MFIIVRKDRSTKSGALICSGSLTLAQDLRHFSNRSHATSTGWNFVFDRWKMTAMIWRILKWIFPRVPGLQKYRNFQKGPKTPENLFLKFPKGFRSPQLGGEITIKKSFSRPLQRAVIYLLILKTRKVMRNQNFPIWVSNREGAVRILNLNISASIYPFGLKL